MRKLVDKKYVEMTPEEEASFIQDQAKINEKLVMKRAIKTASRQDKLAAIAKLKTMASLSDQEVKALFR